MRSLPGAPLSDPRAKTGSSLFDDLVGAGEQRLGHHNAEAFAVFRLMTSSNLVGCWTGRLAGFAPFKIFPA